VRNWSYITPALLRAELSRIGYTEVDSEGPSGATWIDPNDDHKPAVLVPREDQRDLRGYEELLESAIERVSWVIGASLGETVERIVLRGDKFELRIIDDSTRGGRLPVLRAPDVVTGFLQVLRGGARAEFRGARASYPGTDPDEVGEALKGIDLLAPAVGSFRLLAVSSIQTQLPLDQGTATPDKSRRAVAAAMRGLRAAAQATSEEIPDEIPEDDEFLLSAIDSGVSTTLLGGLEKINAEAPGMTVEFSASWDPELPAVDAPDEGIVLQPTELHRVPRIVTQLKRHEPEEHRFVMGWVKTATADALAEAGHPAGLVMVETKVENKARTVLIELPPGQFEQVRPGVSMLRAKGTLERISGRWHLTDPSDIRISD
jgi:hypothetical protein